MSLRIILVFTAFIEDMLKLNLVCFFLFCYENELNDRTIIRTFRTPLVFHVMWWLLQRTVGVNFGENIDTGTFFQAAVLRIII